MDNRPTGRDNADAFVNEVLSDNNGIVIKYASTWPWMCNEEWRDYVLNALAPSSMFRDMAFSPPSGLEGWTFVAYRKSAKLPISDRSLDDPAI